MSSFTPHLKRFNAIAGPAISLGCFASVAWSMIWFLIAVRHGNFWSIDQWSAGPLAISQALLIVLPLVAVFLLVDRRRHTIGYWFTASVSCAFLAISVYLLGSYSCLLTCLTAAGLLIVFSILNRHPDNYTSSESVESIGTITPDNEPFGDARQEGVVAPIAQTPLKGGQTVDSCPPVNPVQWDLESDLEDPEATENDEESGEDWLQQLTWRLLPPESEPNTHQVEWFGRHEWSANETAKEMHILFQPAFAKTPKIDVELVEGDARIKIAEQQPHGVRLELKCNKEGNSSPVLVWLTATGQLTDPSTIRTSSGR